MNTFSSADYLSIKEPCFVGWDNMTPSEKGKFCSSCQKHVHDFTNYSIEDIKKAYKENKGRLCGHIPTKILTNEYIRHERNKFKISYLKNFSLAALLCFGINLFTIDSVKASIIYSLKQKIFSKNVIEINDSSSIKGKVTDIDGKAIPYATIEIYADKKLLATCKTDELGKYKISFPLNNFSVVELKSSMVGYNTHSYTISISKDIKKVYYLSVTLSEKGEKLDGMIIKAK